MKLTFGRVIAALAILLGGVGYYYWQHLDSKPVPAGVQHAAIALSFSAFANLERWSGNPTSAATDFNPA